MRRRTAYRFLSFFTLAIAVGAAGLAIVAFVLAHIFEAGAAALCAAVFVVPGILFLNQWRRLYARDLALAHAASLAEAAGAIDGKSLAEKLQVPPEDATKILRTAVREGVLQGTVDEEGHFVSATAPRCPKCGAVLAPADAKRTCPACGTALAGGE